MADFLSVMAEASRRRVEAAKLKRPEEVMRSDLASRPAPPSLALQQNGFDVFAEIKRRAPSAGTLREDAGSQRQFLTDQAQAYAEGGAAAISVLTEPSSFNGELADLESVVTTSHLPVMRKDFLVDPYQVYEAYAHGAAVVLLIARMLDEKDLPVFFDAAQAASQFVVMEIFDEVELPAVETSISLARARGVFLLVGVNARNLETLAVDRQRFARLAPKLPRGIPRVAESGLATAEEVEEVASLGYDVALIGSALMRAPDAETLLGQMIDAGRQAVARCA